MSGLAYDPACGDGAYEVHEFIPYDRKIALDVCLVKAFIVFVMVKDEFEEPAIIVTQIRCLRIEILIRFQDEQAERGMFLFIFFTFVLI